MTRKRGASGLAYGLLVGLIGIVALAATQSTGRSVTSLFTTTADTLDPAASATLQGEAPPESIVSAPTPAPSPMAMFAFSTCGAMGRTGPDLSACSTAYQGTALDGNVVMDPSGRQLWTVPVSGTYRITAEGAAGGNAVAVGGSGARVSAEFTLTGGTEITLVIGQRGGQSGNTSDSGNSAGGGGGTFVVNATSSTLLLAAGGGGGAGVDDGATSSLQAGRDADWQQMDGASGQDNEITAGSAGGGGTLCTGNGASSGAGWSGDSVAYASTSWATAASSWSNGSTGSEQRTANGGDGGYGGGGAGAYGGGGGGGYSGGACGSYHDGRDAGGGGGGSYIATSGQNQSGASGVSNGDGSVVIEQIN